MYPTLNGVGESALTSRDVFAGVRSLLGSLGADGVEPTKEFAALVEKVGPFRAMAQLFGPMADLVYAAMVRAKKESGGVKETSRRIATEYTVTLTPTKFATVPAGGASRPGGSSVKPSVPSATMRAATVQARDNVTK